jgi:cytochrome c oxidase subunit 2
VLCTEYCGDGHSTMRAQVVALDELEYLARLERLPKLAIAGPVGREPSVVGQLPSESLSLGAMGERVAVSQGCLRCHTADGTPHIGPTWANVYRSQVELRDGERIVADEAYLTESMMDPNAKIRSGFEPVMPSYQGLLSAAEAGALVEYIRSLSQPLNPPASSPLAPRGAPPLMLPTDDAPAPTPSGARAP